MTKIRELALNEMAAVSGGSGSECREAAEDLARRNNILSGRDNTSSYPSGPRPSPSSGGSGSGTIIKPDWSNGPKINISTTF